MTRSLRPSNAQFTPHVLQGIEDGSGKALEIQPLGRGRAADKGEIDVAEVVEHRASAAHPPDHGDLVRLHEIFVDLRESVLISTDNDGRLVAPVA